MIKRTIRQDSRRQFRTRWFAKTPRSVLMDVIDGVAYALLTAGFFGWLWPRAATDAMAAIGG